MRSEQAGRADIPITESDERPEAAATVTSVPDFGACRKAQNGNHEFGGSGPEFQEKILEIMAGQISNVHAVMPKLTPGGDEHPNLNIKLEGRPNTTKSSLGLRESKPNKPKSMWTRLNRMDVGPIESASIITKSMTGKRGMEDALAAEYNRDTESTFHKCSKVVKEDGNEVNISAGGDDHLCREQ